MPENSSSSSSAASFSSSDSVDDFLVAKGKGKADTSRNTKTGVVEDDRLDININQKYAREYEVRKRREELQNNRNINEEDGISDSDSSDESEDEEAELLTPHMDVKIIKTLRALKSKDEGIYDQNVAFFSDNDSESGDDDETGDGKRDKTKPKRYKDLVREQILEQMESGEGKDLGDTDKAQGPEAHNLAYDQEQRDIRRAFLDSTRDSDNEQEPIEDEEDENWLKPKAKTSSAKDENEEELKKLWEQEFSTKSELVDPKGEVQDGDQFLMEFMTNRKWVDPTDSAMRKVRDIGNGDDDDESIQSFQDKMDDFESKYNFRFEEAQAAANAAEDAANETSGATHSIVHYARGSVDDNVLRRKDESRRQKRLQRKERKAEERKAKEEVSSYMFDLISILRV